MSAPRVLIVDDEPDMLENCSRILSRQGYACTTAGDGAAALAILERERPDLMLTDFKMPGMDGLTLLRRAHELDPALPIIMITGFATIESAVAAVKEGAFDYLPKDFSVDQLRVAVERALRHRGLQVENRNLRQQLQQALGLENIVGHSPAMTQVFELVKKAARSEANILILGESGTGKELIARAIHANSPRASQPFVPVDCASLPEQLLESELFGHEKGAFTGAVRTKPGLMETAHRGTLFLDEIAELPAPLQVKLLRVLQERQIRRVGGTALVDVDVRVVSATNRDLNEAIAKGQFREELFYRVNVIAIHLPPLRERAGDVRLLAHTFLKRYGQGRVTAMEDAVDGGARAVRLARQRARAPERDGAGLRARRWAHRSRCGTCPITWRGRSRGLPRRPPVPPRWPARRPGPISRSRRPRSSGSRCWKSPISGTCWRVTTAMSRPPPRPPASTARPSTG